MEGKKLCLMCSLMAALLKQSTYYPSIIKAIEVYKTFEVDLIRHYNDRNKVLFKTKKYTE